LELELESNKKLIN